MWDVGCEVCIPSGAMLQFWGLCYHTTTKGHDSPSPVASLSPKTAESQPWGRLALGDARWVIGSQILKWDRFKVDWESSFRIPTSTIRAGILIRQALASLVFFWSKSHLDLFPLPPRAGQSGVYLFEPHVYRFALAPPLPSPGRMPARRKLHTRAWPRFLG